MKNTYVDRFEVHHVLSREDQGSDFTTGRLDADKVKAYNGKFFDVATTTGHFLCGPLGMIEGVSGVLESLGTAKSTIHFELFNTAGWRCFPKCHYAVRPDGSIGSQGV